MSSSSVASCVGQPLTLFTASEELQAQFTSLLSTPDTFGLLITIEKEALVPVTTISSTSSSFTENLQGLQQHLKPDVALYILLRRYDDSPRLLALTYVPDAAPVRQKMLFASTRLTLVRELGSEHFRETIFATTAEELSEAGFKKHDAHSKLDAPLTEEERTLGEVKRAEQETGTGTGTREIHLSKSLKMPVGEDALAAMTEVGQDGGRTVAMLVSHNQPPFSDRCIILTSIRKSIPRPRASSSFPSPPPPAPLPS